MKKPKVSEGWLKRRSRLEGEAQAYGGFHRGLAHTTLARPRGLKGLDSYGAASPVRTLNEAERKAIEDAMRKEGKL